MRAIKNKKVERVKKLRKNGFSYQEIANKLNIAKSTAYNYGKDVKLNKKAKVRLQSRVIEGSIKGVEIRIRSQKKLIDNFTKKAKKELFNNLIINQDISKILCALLFWCEGNKNDTTIVRFTNSDPKMIKLFLYLFRLSFKIDESKFRALIHLHEYHDEEKQIKFWSRVTQIPENQFYNSYQKPNTGKRKKENYPGCLALSYYNDKISKELWAIYHVIQELPKNRPVG